MFPAAGARGRHPEAHELAAVPPALLRRHHRRQRQPDFPGPQGGAGGVLAVPP